MTLRLVAVMSVVLLLCLGAFGLIANYFQEQVMVEAAKIASESAKAIFGTLDATHDRNFFHVNQTQRPDGLARAPEPPAAPGRADQTELRIVGDIDPEETRKLIEEVARRRLGVPETADGSGTGEPPKYSFSALGRFVSVECSEGENGVQDCVRVHRQLSGAELNEVFVRVEEIHASTDGEEMTLTIPTFKQDPLATDPDVVKGQWESDDIRLVNRAAADEPVTATDSEIQLPISVQDYESLFDRVRRQSIFLFLGVFLVGMVLSAGAAARFTRPTRRLDAALREISDGDLDAEVEVRGKDEMARLGLAFNEMARKMRANRDRAREMVRRDKLSALGRLAAGVAHDVRNPLHSIGLTLSHLDDTGRPEEPERAAEFDRAVTLIRGEIRRLDQLVVNFLRFANGDNRERRSVDLRALVEETERLFRKEAQWRGIELSLDLEDVPELRVDAEAIRSSLLNLVLNSCEAMPEGGKLDISLRRNNGEVVLQVADTGRGIPADRQEKVFDFGYSTTEGGSGLGLVMVHQCVVEDHDGRVTLDSTEGEGTRVRLIFPVKEENDDSSTEQES
ncbi:MAG: HAMP domain-containing protein [Acidobacteria bacterium]|nr:HAMP domain-containing protein [Acidobacteriota bacterium]NIM62332.1 HAMP domain-containing protein [Acidobacteriota bacterium]NIO60665.1 HAMP domain-containing protein [Acidobacteriota bacterium]NIQ85098.1 HAMP domain-containing protein [Acidobacteriota bacterium]NIT12309.1 HAMP domain-containing protein [Acidobacteriota bacterium]